MSDCPNVGVREALPDLLHGTLQPDRQVAVRAHVDCCDACRRELALLARVRESLSAPAMATDRIASRIPHYERASPWRRVARGRVLRIAAAVVILAGGWVVLRNAGPAPATTTADSTRNDAPVELAVGETFADVSDSALVALVEAMADLEPVLSDDPETIAVPLLPAEGL